MLQLIIALLIATTIPVVVLVAINRLNLYSTGSFVFVLMCFGAGTVGTLVASRANPWLGGILQADYLRVAVLIAPIVEECLKGAFLFFVFRSPRFAYFVDGAIYGFAAGIGFAISENFLYLMGQPDIALNLSIARVLSTNLMHATTTSLVGTTLGLARFEKRLSAFVYGLSGLLIAVVIHVAFNRLAITWSDHPLLVLYAAAAGFAGVGLVYGVIKLGLNQARGWMHEILGRAVDRVTSGENALVNRLPDVDKLLAPFQEMFGQAKAEQVKKLLVLQSQLGIQRKTLESLSEASVRAGVERQVQATQAEMDRLRREVGAYAMLYVRNVFPPETPLWDRLETLAQERLSKRAGESHAGIWARLGTVEAQARETEESE